MARIGCDRSSGWFGLWALQYRFRHRTGEPPTEHLPAGLRLGARMLFYLATHSQTGHTTRAILSES